MTVDYVAKVQGMDWKRLSRLWARIAKGTRVHGWPNGKALEHLVLRGFELDGAKVVWPFSVTMGGEVVEQIDGVIHLGHISCLIECKHTSGPVNVEPLAKLRNQLLRRHSGAVGAVFSVKGFTMPAQTLAQFMAPQAVMLWEGLEIEEMLKIKKFREPFMRKYEVLVQEGFPNFNIRTANIP